MIRVIALMVGLVVFLPQATAMEKCPKGQHMKCVAAWCGPFKYDKRYRQLRHPKTCKCISGD